jgi:hypothetical protein
MIIDLVKLSKKFDKEGNIREADKISDIINKIAASENPKGITAELARKEYDDGVEEYGNENYEAAKVHFIKGYNLSNKNPSFLFNIGMCAFRSGDSDMANSYMRTFLSSNPDPKKKQQAKSIVMQIAENIDGNNNMIASNLTKEIVNTVKSVGKEADEPVIKQFVDGILA